MRACLTLPPFLLVALTLLLLSSAATAQSTTRFDAPQSYRERMVLDFVRSSHEGTDAPLSLARVDVNDDFIQEYIIRRQKGRAGAPLACTPQNFCDFILVAMENHAPVIIGNFSGYKLVISHEKTYGIRAILIYNHAHNDFTFQTARWTPTLFAYQVE